MDKQTQIDKAKRFLELHHQNQLLLLPNIWDPLGARLLKATGYPAVATASAAVAFAQGFDDGEHIPYATMLEIIRSIASSVDLPVTADIETGYAENSADVAENMRLVIRAGAVGINIEDSIINTEKLRSIDAQCDRIAAIRRIASEEQIPLVINARVDVFSCGVFPTKAENLAETMTRAKAYLAAGANCIYPLLLQDLDSLKQLADHIQAPLNVYAMASLPPMNELLAAGVKRLSLGPGLLKATLAGMKKIVVELKDTGSYDSFSREALSSDEVRGILGKEKELTARIAKFTTRETLERAMICSMKRALALVFAIVSLASDVQAITKWDLWSTGTKLRGANIYQRRVYPQLDGSNLGPAPAGPPYTQEDFNRLASMGCNYVNISHPGLFREKPPYTADLRIQKNLDRLITMIGNANMFAVISFRTGPGRSEFTFFFDQAGTWFDRSYLNDQVWRNKAAQDAWSAMWKYAAQRYKNNPVVVGYDLMVEPNSNHVWLNLWDPQQFYAQYSGTLYDWNPFFPRIIRSIRTVDATTPILVGGMDYSAVSWLPYLKRADDARTVYAAHQYEPFEYTTQPPQGESTYPGLLDLDFDGQPDPFNRAWLNRFFSIFDRFKQLNRVPVASNEFGVMRWEPGAARFMFDEMSLFEQRGMNYALWIWSGSWPQIVDFDDFDFLHGSDPNNHTQVASKLLTTIQSYWKRNRMRPSNVVFTDITGPAVPLCCSGPEAAAPEPPAHSSPHKSFPLPHTSPH